MVGKGTYRTKEEKARIVMEVLSNTSTIAEICRKYNVAASAVYKWRDEFISAGTAAMEHGRSTTFSAWKLNFGDSLKSKNLIAEKNELFCRAIAYNITVLIHEMFELGIKPNFISAPLAYIS